MLILFWDRLSTSMIKKVTWGLSLYNFSIKGNSWRHGLHQVAKKLINIGSTLSNSSLKAFT